MKRLFKSFFDRTLLLYVLLGIGNYLVCNAVMLLLNIVLHISEDLSLLIEFLLQTFNSFFLNRYVTFRDRRVNRLWPLFSLLIVALSYLLAKVLLRDLFLAWLQSDGMQAGIEALRQRLGVTMAHAEFSAKLVMLLCTLFYSIVNYFGQRYLAFRPDRRKLVKYGIIWDLDGTLWDSGEWVSVAWNDYCRAHNIDKQFTPDDCRSYCGKTLAQIAAVVFPDAEPEWREQVITACCDAECIPLAEHGGTLYPGLEPILESLHRQYFMAVVSNCGLGYIEAFYTGNHTKQYFDDEENAARTGLGKAENIRLVMQRNGVDRAVYIGDTQGDYNAAKEAGALFIHAAYGFGDAPEAAWRIHALEELPAVIENVFSDSEGN